MSEEAVWIKGETPILMATEYLEAHLERFCGPITNRIGDIGAELDAKNIQLNVIAPTVEHPFYTLCTMGMSNITMPSPDGLAKNIELIIRLNSDWDFSAPSSVWPLQHLREICWYVYNAKTWLGLGHTLPQHGPIGPDTTLTGFLVGFPYVSPVDFITLDLGVKQISFFSLIPLYEEEMNFKIAYGSDAMFDLLEEHDMTDLWNLERPNLCG